MGTNRCFLLSVLVGALLASLPLHPAAADHPIYELPSRANWDHGDLSVLIVPPAHGQVWNAETGVLNGEDPNELTPFNSYLEAIEAAIKAWDDAIDLLGADWLSDYYEPTIYVLGRDSVPAEVVASPDILVITDENHGPSLGTSIWAKTGHVRTPCIVRMSSSYIGSFTYADMYNITAQEYGHCLGLNHVGSQGGVDPLSEQKHPEHDVMNGFYADSPGEAGTHLHCVSNLNIMALEHVFDYEMAYSAVLNLGVEGITYVPAYAYGDTCSPPPTDWRSMVQPTGLPGSVPMRSEITDPVDGSRLLTHAFRKVTGSAVVDQSIEEVPYEVNVAIARIGADGSCEWWDVEARSFRSRDCHSPTWSSASLDGDWWSWKPPSKLPPGSYRVVARIETEYGNESLSDPNTAEFRLKRPR